MRNHGERHDDPRPLHLDAGGHMHAEIDKNIHQPPPKHLPIFGGHVSCGGFSPPHALVTLDFAQVVAFGAILVGTPMTGTTEVPDSGGALSSKDVTKAIISMGGDDGDDDPDKKPWKGIYAEF